MTTFALITEGRTDQAVIENILYGFSGTYDIDIHWVLPLRDETDLNRIENFSNWALVFEFCKSKKFKQSLQINDYVVVQVDTDVSDEPNYDVPKFENGKELEVDELINRVKIRITNLITDEVYSRFKDRIIFAVCVHSLECWLLPIFYKDKKASKTKGCLSALNMALQKTKGVQISGSKNVKIYEDISSVFCKNKELRKLSFENPSFKLFIKELEDKGILDD